MLKIRYYGHSCFSISDGVQTVILDPYADHSVPGLKLPDGLKADKVYCSHQHSDHNARDLIEETAFLDDPFSPVFLTVPHDEVGGQKRGLSDITILKVDGRKIVHFGDIGRLPDAAEYKEMEGADILMIPVGGHFTIDARQAKAIIERLQPSCSILMHFRKGNIGYDVLASLDDVCKVFPYTNEMNTSDLLIEDEIPHGEIVLQPYQ